MRVPGLFIATVGLALILCAVALDVAGVLLMALGSGLALKD